MALQLSLNSLTRCGGGFARSVGRCRTLRLTHHTICLMLGFDMESVQPNQSAPVNRRPALQLDGSDCLSTTFAADRAFLAAVCDLRRWPSQTDHESRHMKATGHGYVRCEVYVVGFRPRPDDNDHRCGGVSVLASPAFPAARSASLGGQPGGPANGSQPTRRVALRRSPVAGSRR
jgi:hypothetical protein